MLRPTDPQASAAGVGARHAEPAQRAYGLLFLGTGAGLTLHIAFGVPLPAGVIMMFSLAAVVVRSVLRRPFDLAPLRRTACIGLVSGLVATAAYDASRLAIVEAFSLELSPFAALPHFGAALTWPGASEAIRTAVGAAFHVTNGVFFGVAFTFFLGGRGAVWGVAWAMGLELAMLTLYPGWLAITPTGEFTAMSLTGHICYGTALALMARTLLRAEAHGRAG